jgi:hypothetical protein
MYWVLKPRGLAGRSPSLLIGVLIKPLRTALIVLKQGSKIQNPHRRAIKAFVIRTGRRNLEK